MTVWLPTVLRAAGLEVTTHGVRGRPDSYEPHGVLNHHTASRSTPANPAPTLQLVKVGRYRNGKVELAGPLCQLLIGADGHCHVITTGRANHAGKARASGPMPAGDGNELYVGIEIDYSGYTAPTPVQYAAAVRANAAILTRMRRPATCARGHRETSTTGKWDPGQIDLDRFRADIATAMRPAPPTPTTPAPAKEDDMQLFVIGKSRYRAVAGDRAIALPFAVGQAMAAGGARVTGITEPDWDILASQLRVESATTTLVDQES